MGLLFIDGTLTPMVAQAPDCRLSEADSKKPGNGDGNDDDFGRHSNKKLSNSNNKVINSK